MRSGFGNGKSGGSMKKSEEKKPYQRRLSLLSLTAWGSLLSLSRSIGVAALSHAVSAPSSTASVGFERRGVR
ncbi:uncharacterized protein G2W53_003745 [Senna tora]|uniref:Uncharacterized protein n=1 Tax=Senna tora TaxID=362788 RepID=A0A834XBM3_9FABA|nr:uncharacterized protein G2W53_003745 [Senna tora]